MASWEDEHENVVTIDDDGGGYDWGAVGIFKRKSDGKLFWATDGGCSCNYAWEYTIDVKPLTRDQVILFIDACKAISKTGHEQALKALREVKV